MPQHNCRRRGPYPVCRGGTTIDCGWYRGPCQAFSSLPLSGRRHAPSSYLPRRPSAPRDRCDLLAIALSSTFLILPCLLQRLAFLRSRHTCNPSYELARRRAVQPRAPQSGNLIPSSCCRSSSPRLRRCLAHSLAFCSCLPRGVLSRARSARVPLAKLALPRLAEDARRSCMSRYSSSCRSALPAL